MCRLLSHFASLALCLLLVFAPAAGAMPVAVPEGNRNVEQPAVPGASVRRTQQTKSSFERKYDKIHELLQRDRRLREKIVAVANIYSIDPLHIVGALVGEHTYNVDAYDRLQSYYIKAMSYASGGVRFQYDGVHVDRFVTRPEFEVCDTATGSRVLWTCREKVWDNSFRNQTVDGKAYPDDRFSAVFFQPFYAGQTFGLGQLNPLTALKLTDLVHEVSGHEKLSHLDGDAVYEAIMNPDVSLAYVAAAIRHAIDAYETIAGFDISTNPGITATLYNVGNPDQRAQVLATINEERKAEGQELQLPQENYYGWLVNDKLDQLKALF